GGQRTPPLSRGARGPTRWRRGPREGRARARSRRPRGRRSARRSRLAGSGLQPGPKGLHRGWPDAVDLVELVDGRDPAVLVTEVDDLLGRDGADPLDRVELLHRRRPEA